VSVVAVGPALDATRTPSRAAIPAVVRAEITPDTVYVARATATLGAVGLDDELQPTNVHNRMAVA